MPAWRHVIDRFHTDGVTNVQWDFSPSRNAFSDDTSSPVTIWAGFYPGNAYVDVCGTQIYNHQDQLLGVQDDPHFVNFYNQCGSTGKELMLSETGAMSQTQSCPYTLVHSDPSPQERWYHSFQANLIGTFPALTKFVNFSRPDAPGGPGGCIDYTLGGNGLTAFKTMAGKTSFSKMP